MTATAHESAGTPAAAGRATDRAALARAALRAAELRTGARRVEMTTASALEETPTSRAVAPTAVVRGAQVESAAPAAEIAARTAERTERALPLGARTVERPPLEVPAPLRPLLPEGLPRGAVAQVTGSTALVLALLAETSAQGAWAAIVGDPAVGVLAAAEMGVDLERLALVPRPGSQAPLVVAALVDGMDVVVVGPDVALLDSDRRALAARARDRGTVILSTTTWPGARLGLNVSGVRWRGLGVGTGRLRSRELLVERVGRGVGAQRAHLEITLPFSAAPEVPAMAPAATTSTEPALAATRPTTPSQPALPLRLVG